MTLIIIKLIINFSIDHILLATPHHGKRRHITSHHHPFDPSLPIKRTPNPSPPSLPCLHCTLPPLLSPPLLPNPIPEAMLKSGLFPGIKSLSSVTLVFRLPYYTQWGQSLLVCGSEPVLGSWNVKQGLALGPSHEGDELIWCGKVAVSVGFRCEYSYYVVDDGRNVLRSEAGKKRRLTLPDGVREGAVVEIRDLWQVQFDLIFLAAALGFPCIHLVCRPRAGSFGNSFRQKRIQRCHF